MMLALRTLAKKPGLTVTILLLLGFGIGANTALFSLVRAILLRPIPGVADPGELVRVRRTQAGRSQGNQSYPDYLDFRDQSKSLAGLAAERLVPLRLSGPPAQFAAGAIVTGNYFQVLGVRPLAGRLLGPEDDRLRDGNPVAVVSEAFWRRELGADPRAVGRNLMLNGYPFTVVGVAGGRFEGVEYAERTEIWLPLTMVRQALPRNATSRLLDSRSAGWLTWYGRLRHGATIGEAQQEWNAIAAGLETLYPRSNQGRRFEIHPDAAMSPEQRAAARRLLILLFAAVAVTLLIACGNVANLLLARAAGRTREMAVRLALGAERATLFRQLLGECLLLGVAGGVLGLLAAPWFVGILARMWQQTLTGLFVPDWRVLGFTLAVSLACVLLCGLAPAWSASSANVALALKEGGPQAGRGRGRLQSWFVIAQVGLSVALVAAGGLVLGSMKRIAAIQPGFRTENVVTATMDLSLAGYSPERGTAFFLELARRIADLPGVRSVSLGKSNPAVDWSDRVAIFRPGEAPADGTSYERSPNAVLTDRNTIAAGYFSTLGIPLVAGRDFTAGDRTGSAPVAIVSQRLAERLWHGQNAIGREILMPVDGRPMPGPIEVVGVAADSRYRSVLDEPPPLLYVPLAQNYDSIARVIVAVDGSRGDFRETLCREIQRLEPDLPLRGAATMQEQIEHSMWQRRAAASVLGLFGMLALLLACTGIHGVVAYLTAQRTREIGIRMALGADRADVLTEVGGQAVRLTLAGIAIGVPLALAARPALADFLYHADGANLRSFGGVALLFLLVAVGAAAVPARRAASIDPASALREE